MRKPKGKRPLGRPRRKYYNGSLRRGMGTCAGLIWLRIETGGSLL